MIETLQGLDDDILIVQGEGQSTGDHLVKFEQVLACTYWIINSDFDYTSFMVVP